MPSTPGKFLSPNIVETKINEKCAISLDLPPLVMYDVFFAFICLSERLGSSFFAAFFAPFPKQGSLGYIPVANCSVILIFKVEPDILPRGLAFRINYLGLGPGRYR